MWNKAKELLVVLIWCDFNVNDVEVKSYEPAIVLINSLSLSASLLFSLAHVPVWFRPSTISQKERAGGRATKMWAKNETIDLLSSSIQAFTILASLMFILLAVLPVSSSQSMSSISLPFHTWATFVPVPAVWLPCIILALVRHSLSLSTVFHFRRVFSLLFFFVFSCVCPCISLSIVYSLSFSLVARLES